MPIPAKLPCGNCGQPASQLAGRPDDEDTVYRCEKCWHHTGVRNAGSETDREVVWTDPFAPTVKISEGFGY